MNSRRKIAYITTYDATDIHKWSGLGFAMYKLIEKHARVKMMGSPPKPIRVLSRLKEYYYKYVTHKTYHFTRSPYAARSYARFAASHIEEGTDLIFSPGTIPIAYLDTDIPKVFYTDATFAGMVDFYSGYSNLCRETLKHGHMLEQRALDSCALAIYSSEWAAESAINYYGASPDKVKVVPFGANLDSERKESDIKYLLDNKSKLPCKLLFIGVEWRRKGCYKAVNIAKRLNQLGLRTILHIVGLPKIPLDPIPDFIVNHGFISKANHLGRKKINSLLAESHFLIVPSVAEAYGLVFSEASSFGLPSLSHDVGGIPTVIRDSFNGKLFDLNTPIENWCEYIMNTHDNEELYHKLCISSFREYQQRINWRVAGEKIQELISMI